MRAWSLLVLLLGSWSICSAQEPLFEHLGRADGLPGSQVLALYEDTTGFIWIGTDGGLARHEGVRIHTWYHDRKDPRSLSNNVVWDITGDERSNVWVATDHGLCRYDPDRGDFERILVTTLYKNATAANRIHRVCSDGNGLLWLLTEEGVHTISTHDGTEVPLPAEGAIPAQLKAPLDRYEIEPDPTRDGLWIGTAKGPVFHDINTRTYTTSSTPQLPFPCLNDPRALGLTPDGADGLYYFTPSTNTFHHADEKGRDALLPAVDMSQGPPNPQFMRTDRTGRLWLSTWSHELWTLAPADTSWHAVQHDEQRPWSISNANTKSWLEDREGRIWIGTFHGLNVVTPAHAGLHLWFPRGVNDRTSITTIFVTGDGRVLLGTEGEGVTVFDPRTRLTSLLTVRSDPRGEEYRRWANTIRVIHPYRNGWAIGTTRGLFHAEDLAGSTMQVMDTTKRLYYGAISFIADKGDHLWAGTWGNGLYELAGDRAVRVESIKDHPLPSRRLLSHVRVGDEDYFGFNAGEGLLRVRSDGRMERYLHQADSSGNSYGVVQALAANDAGTVYIGTVMGGLGVMDPRTGSTAWYTRSDGLTGDRVEQLLFDHHGLVWVRTNEGLCRFNERTRAIDAVSLPSSVRSMGSLNSMALDGDDALLLAYGPLLVRMPIDRSESKHVSPVVVTKLIIAGRERFSPPMDSAIVLDHDHRDLAIEFGSAHYFGEQDLRFSYRVRDLDTAWIELGTSTRLDLNDLPPGRHSVELRSNAGGSAWSLRNAFIDVRVRPPFWGTWWFRVGALLVAIAAAAVGFRVYLRERLREQRERYEREQAVLSERVRIAGDMHDDLGAGLSALKLRSEMALRIEKDPLKREQLGLLARTAGELIGSMRQIIWTMNADQASVEDLVVYATNYARTYCDENGLQAVISTDPQWSDVLLSSEQRRNVFLVMKEALHNVVKHASATRVEIRMHMLEGLSVEIQDDGVGMPQHASAGVGNGLRNMEKRIVALGGRYTVDRPESGKGTRIRFHVPIHPADGNEGSIARSNEH